MWSTKTINAEKCIIDNDSITICENGVTASSRGSDIHIKNCVVKITKDENNIARMVEITGDKIPYYFLLADSFDEELIEKTDEVPEKTYFLKRKYIHCGWHKLKGTKPYKAIFYSILSIEVKENLTIIRIGNGI